MSRNSNQTAASLLVIGLVEISDEEAIASVQAMLDEFDGRKPH